MPIKPSDTPPSITLVCGCASDSKIDCYAMDSEYCVSFIPKTDGSVWLTIDDTEQLITHLKQCIAYNKEQSND